MSKNIDKQENRDLLSKLEDLGLTEKEARVYLALLPRHDTGTSNLIRATGLHGQFVYAALDTLEELGLAQHVIQNGRKKFSANPPERIVALIDEKKLTARAVAKELHNRFKEVHQQSFEVFQGENAFVGHELAMLERVPEGSRIDVITGLGEEYLSTIGHEVEEYERLRVQKKIEIRVISTEKRRGVFEKMSKKRQYWDYKIFPGLGTGVVDIGIWHDTIVYNILGHLLCAFHLRANLSPTGTASFSKRCGICRASS